MIFGKTQPQTHSCCVQSREKVNGKLGNNFATQHYFSLNESEVKTSLFMKKSEKINSWIVLTTYRVLSKEQEDYEYWFFYSKTFYYFFLELVLSSGRFKCSKKIRDRTHAYDEHASLKSFVLVFSNHFSMNGYVVISRPKKQLWEK